MTHRGRALLLVAASALVILAGCTSGGTEASEQRPSATTSTTPRPQLPQIDSYVAIGDSFTAGPGLARLRKGSGFCLRSTNNWPSLLSRAIKAGSFDDESCIGAATNDLLNKRAIPGAVVPAQISAVRRRTELVTVGIGGNDGGLFTSLISACTQRTGACGSFADETVPTVLTATGPRIVEALRQIRDQAPDARILLVGYLRVLPDSGACKLVPIPAAEASKGVEAEQALDDALAAAARKAGVEFVSMRRESRGHDACAGADAWTNGGSVPDDDGVVFHPRLAGMRAVARAVAAQLASR